MAVAKKRNIRRSAGFDKKEMEGYFMIANKDAALAIINKLTGSQLRLFGKHSELTKLPDIEAACLAFDVNVTAEEV